MHYTFRHFACGAALVILSAFLLTGCGPSDEEVLIYEIVLVVLGFGLGAGMIALGRLIGRRWMNKGFGWFRCPQCDRRLRVGTQPDCPGCGALLVAEAGEAKSVRPVMIDLRRMRTSAWHTLSRAMLWAAASWLALSIPWIVVRLITGGDPADVAGGVGYEQLLLFPVAFVFLSGPPGLGIMLLFYSFHLVSPLIGLLPSDLPMWLAMPLCYLLIFVALTAHWYVGLRRWRRWWLLPTIVAGVNLIVAVLGYFLA